MAREQPQPGRRGGVRKGHSFPFVFVDVSLTCILQSGDPLLISQVRLFREILVQLVAVVGLK